jgi:hypothetical protein
MAGNMTFGRLLIALAFGPLVLMVFACARSNWVCIPQGRYVSTHERIAVALAYMARDIKGFPENPSPDDIDAFIRDNPGCCSIERTGLYAGWVQFVFELKPHRIRPSQPNDVAYESYVFVNECGAKTDFSGIPITLDAMQAMRRQVRKES